MLERIADHESSENQALDVGADEADRFVQPNEGMPRPPIRKTAGQSRSENNCTRASGADDHSLIDIHNRNVIGQPKRLRQSRLDTLPFAAQASDDGGLLCGEAQREGAPVIAEIVQNWRRRQRWLRAEVSLGLQAKAICRQWTDGDKDKASALFDSVQDGKSAEEHVTIALEPYLESIAFFAPRRKQLEKSMARAVEALPIYAWVKAHAKGFGAGNLAAVIGEAGDIGNYRTPSCLWKRMGMAVIGGERQGKRTDADEALLHGYSPRRRSVAWTLGDTLSKKQLVSAAKSGTEYGKPAGPYGEVYVKRRERTAVTHPDWTKAHSLNDARRVMAKAALRDLWVEWRRVMNG